MFSSEHHSCTKCKWIFQKKIAPIKLFISLTLSVPIPEEEKKIKLDFHFHTTLWCLKRFYEGYKGLHKTFRGTTKCENKNLT